MRKGRASEKESQGSSGTQAKNYLIQNHPFQLVAFFTVVVCGVGASLHRDFVQVDILDGRDLDAMDVLIEAGIRSTRSDAAAWLIHAGIEANRPLFEKVYGTVAEIRRLRVVAQSLAQEVAGSGEDSTESMEGQPQ